MSHTGTTLKGFGQQDFYRKLASYKEALQSGNNQQIVATSIAIHSAKGNPGVTRRMRVLVGRAFREAAQAA